MLVDIVVVLVEGSTYGVVTPTNSEIAMKAITNTMAKVTETSITLVLLSSSIM
jgi:hypothetical protein